MPNWDFLTLLVAQLLEAVSGLLYVKHVSLYILNKSDGLFSGLYNFKLSLDEVKNTGPFMEVEIVQKLSQNPEVLLRLWV